MYLLWRFLGGKSSSSLVAGDVGGGVCFGGGDAAGAGSGDAAGAGGGDVGSEGCWACEGGSAIADGGGGSACGSKGGDDGRDDDGCRDLAGVRCSGADGGWAPGDGDTELAAGERTGEVEFDDGELDGGTEEFGNLGNSSVKLWKLMIIPAFCIKPDPELHKWQSFDVGFIQSAFFRTDGSSGPIYCSTPQLSRNR
jgi:hypothetical protein